MTSACNVSPEEWLFYNNGECCVSGDEPFLIADWIGTLCNGSEWRMPFDYYGGMAREDWEEWIEAWNWTVRPQNSSTANVTLSSCASASATLLTWGIDNIVEFFSASLFIVLIVLFGVQYVHGFAGDKYHWRRTILAGLIDFSVARLLGNFVAAIVIRRTPGYQDVPVGGLALLFFTRPSIIGFLCCFALLLRNWTIRRPRLADRIAEHFAKKGGDFHRYTADMVGSLLIAEILHHSVALVYLGIATGVGGRKDFYRFGNLVPFWRGSEAQRMYAGALLYTILFAFNILFMCALAVFIVTWIYHDQKWLDGVIAPLADRGEKLYEVKRQHEEALSQQRVDEAADRAVDDVTLGVAIFTSQTLGLLFLIPFAFWNFEEVEEEIERHERLVEQNEQRQKDENKRRWKQKQKQKQNYAALMAEVRRRYPNTQELRRDLGKVANGVVWAAVALFSVVYIAQWLFWSGFIESSGNRWCLPPDNGIPQLQGILSALSALGIGVNFFVNLQGA